MRKDWIALVLSTGVAASFSLVIAGLVLWAALGLERVGPLRLQRLSADIFSGEPASLVSLGLLLLLLTPIARVITLIADFARQRDRAFLVLSIVVLLLLVTSILAGVLQERA